MIQRGTLQRNLQEHKGSLICTVSSLTCIRHFIQSHLPSVAHASPAHMASLVPQGYPGGMDVTAVTDIRDPREWLDQRDFQDCEEQREKLEPRARVDEKGSAGMGHLVWSLIRTGKSAHGKTWMTTKTTVWSRWLIFVECNKAFFYIRL